MRTSMPAILVSLLLLLTLPFAVGRRFYLQSEYTPCLAQDEGIKSLPPLKHKHKALISKIHGMHRMKSIKNQVLQVAGSTIPDCTHACGGCSPCIRVTVSFKCSIAESCPIAYRCMCKGKTFPIPSDHTRP